MDLDVIKKMLIRVGIYGNITFVRKHLNIQCDNMHMVTDSGALNTFD